MTLITQKREAVGLTMTECARRAGIDLAKLSRIERGIMPLKLPDIARLARALGCDTKDLVPSLEELEACEAPSVETP